MTLGVHKRNLPIQTLDTDSVLRFEGKEKAYARPTVEGITAGHSRASTPECPLGGVAQLGRATDFESVGCGSDPRRPHQT
jgi:hypothetical protein